MNRELDEDGGHPDAAARMAAAFCIAVAALWYAHVAALTALNPDEALLAVEARQASFAKVLDMVRNEPHPPLYAFALHLVASQGASEVWLRAPSALGVLIGVAFLFVWMRRGAGSAGALAAIGLVAFSPAVVNAATELRPYGFVCAGVGAALWTFERLCARPGFSRAGAHGIALSALLATHYGSVVLVVATGVVGLLQAARSRELRAPWIVSQSIAAATALGLYSYFVAPYFENVGVQRGYLPAGYWGGDTSPLLFLRDAYLSVGRYQMGQPDLGMLSVALFLLGVARAITAGSWGRRAAGLLVLPFAVAAVTAIAGWLPLTGSRHNLALCLLLAVGAGWGIARLVGDRAVVVLLMLLVGTPLWLWAMPTANQREAAAPEDVRALIDFVRNDIPESEPLFVDDQTYYLLVHYLDQEGSVPAPSYPAGTGLKRATVERRTLFGLVRWTFPKNEFGPLVSEMARNSRSEPGPIVWVVAARWHHLPSLVGLDGDGVRLHRRFGAMEVLRVRVQPW